MVLSKAVGVNPLLCGSWEQLEGFVQHWIPGLSKKEKQELILQLSVGEGKNNTTSIWKGDGFLAATKRFFDSMSVKTYTEGLLYKDELFEDKEWLTDMSDGQEIIEAMAQAEREAKAAQEALKKATTTKPKK